MDQKYIRNFCIIAHIDHGKSTLSDRLLEKTGTVEKRKMKEQLLDQMDLERERGITIKLAPARMSYTLEGISYSFNLIDTPGHVDFTYEVSRSLAAVEGAILLVDATQGVQAQTIGNLHLALEQNLSLIPVLNKIDLPAANVEKCTQELVSLLGCQPWEILCVSGKTGEGVEILLQEIVKRIPAPSGKTSSQTRALIFDSHYDEYKGVVAYVRIVDGTLQKQDLLYMMASKTKSEILDVGALNPQACSLPKLETGQIGYVVTGLKDLSSCRVGDTVTLVQNKAQISLPGYRVVKPMVFAGIFPKEGNDFARLREAMEKLVLNDASLTYEPETSPALGFGFRLGLLGLLHLEIVKERLQREYDLDLIVTTPSVAYRVQKTDGTEEVVKSPVALPEITRISYIQEPWVRADMVTPKEYMGAVMSLVQERRGVYVTTEYLAGDRAILHYEMPLAMIIVDFYDKLKSSTSGYASLNYELLDYREADVVRLDILVAEEKVDALASFVYREEAEKVGRRLTETLKESLPQQQFVLKIQAAVGGKIVAAERISALRKDVTAKLYGGDVTRKRKLLEKQKKGKARLGQVGKGKVDIPSDTYLKILKR